MIDSGGRPDQPAGWWERASLRVRVVLVGLALALVGGVVGAVQIWGDDDGTPSATSAGYVVPATADDLERLVADHVAQFGTSRSYGVSLQAALSVVRAPVDEGSGRYQEWRPTREGGFEAGGEVRDAGEYREFDLADVDLAALDANLDAAWEGLRVPDPTYATLVVERARDSDQPRVTIHVHNDFEEYGYLVTDLAGTVLETRVFDPEAS
ncbi:hypothetical protein [Nocardioides daphniae]|uniref:PepSY domain-containing protein n=1 Tax=Nocardioides daphniae TaxID=402297 RepID=A0ABQ1QLU6_9ACTN|nr:hypothetical protein [Nocardioides daphniae]GGD31197.1 hypothetical protein GCM10007231_33430 [Nocardioides daphniae]